MSGVIPLVVMEAITSVAMTHEHPCLCITCRAAKGDDDALLEVLTAVADVDLADESAVRGAGV